MKKGQLTTLASFVGGIKIASVSDKAIRNIITHNHLALYRKAKEIAEDEEELRKKLFDGKEAQIQAHNELVGKIRAETDNEARKALESQIDKEVVSIIYEFLQSRQTISQEEIEVSIKALTYEQFGDLISQSKAEWRDNQGNAHPVTLADYPFFEECGLIKEDNV